MIYNADPIDHEFIIGPPETHDIHERGEPHFHTGAVQGEVTVPAGATVETTWTFGPSGTRLPTAVTWPATGTTACTAKPLSVDR